MCRSKLSKVNDEGEMCRVEEYLIKYPRMEKRDINKKKLGEMEAYKEAVIYA